MLTWQPASSHCTVHDAVLCRESTLQAKLTCLLPAVTATSTGWYRACYADLASLVASSTTITSWQTGSRIQVQKELRRALDCPYSKPLAALNHCRC